MQGHLESKYRKKVKDERIKTQRDKLNKQGKEQLKDMENCDAFQMFLREKVSKLD